MVAMGIFYHNLRAGSHFYVLYIFCNFYLIVVIAIVVICWFESSDAFVCVGSVRNSRECLCVQVCVRITEREVEREWERDRLNHTSRANVKLFFLCQSNRNMNEPPLLSPKHNSVFCSYKWISGFTYQRITAGVLYCVVMFFISWFSMILLLIEQDRVSLMEFVSMEHGEKGQRRRTNMLLFLLWRFGMGQSLMKMCTKSVWDIHSDFGL